MERELRRPVLLLGGLVLAVVAAGVASMSLPPPSLGISNEAELERLYMADRADRAPAGGRATYPTPGPARERVRRVREILERDRLTTGADYYHAAAILQHAGQPSDLLLAHELSMVALALGDQRARWLAVATLDRYLMESGRAQRWGTQQLATPDDPAAAPHPIEPGVTDTMREVMDVPILEGRGK